MQESHIDSKLKQAVLKRGGFIRKLMWEGRRDAPDRFIILNSKIYLVELKAPTGRLSDGQKEEFKTLAKHGVPVYVVRGLNQLDDFLKVIDSAAANPT